MQRISALFWNLLWRFKNMSVRRGWGKVCSWFVCFFVCLFCFFIWNRGAIIHIFIAFLQFPKNLQCYSYIALLIWFYILFRALLLLLPLVLLSIYFNKFYGGYQWAKYFCSTLDRSFLGSFISSGLELCWKRTPGYLEIFWTLWCCRFYFYIMY